MTRAEFVSRLAEKLEISKIETGRVVDGALGLLTDILTNGDRVRFPGFGTFKILKRKPRVGRNPRTGEPVNIPARTVPRFTPAKELKASVTRTR